jgi:hypothetical protein
MTPSTAAEVFGSARTCSGSPARLVASNGSLAAWFFLFFPSAVVRDGMASTAGGFHGFNNVLSSSSVTQEFGVYPRQPGGALSILPSPTWRCLGCLYKQ